LTSIRLVLNADDLGLTAPLSRAVVTLLKAGHLTDTSLLACGEAFDDAAGALREAGIGSAGVHLCLVGGDRPVSEPSEVPSLVVRGRFRESWPVVAGAVAAGRIRVRDVEREWEAQICRVTNRGLRVTHLDSHQHLHLLPTLLPVALRLARRHDVAFVRAPRSAAASGTALPMGARGKGRLLSLFGERARRMIRTVGLPDPPGVIGLAEAGRMTLEQWRSIVSGLGPGDYEAVLHPGDDDEETPARYRWGYRWAEEAEVLRSRDLSALFSETGVQAVSFGDLSPD